MSRDLRFIYRDAKGETSQRTLSNWQEVGHYLRGVDDASRSMKTFRKDRVIKYLDGCAVLLEEPSPEPPKLIPRQDKVSAPQIIFTGFPRVQRAVLEERARSAGMDVRQSVTKGLMFLVAGPNAGPSKLETARMQRVYVLSEPQFRALLQTGELPADDDTEG